MSDGDETRRALDARAAAALDAAERIAAEPGIDVVAFGRRLAAELAELPEPGWDEVLHSGPEVDVSLELHRIAAQATARSARQRQYDMAVVRRQLELVRLGRSLHEEFVAPAGTYGSAVSPEAVALWRRFAGLFRRSGGRRRRPQASAAGRRRARRVAVWIVIGVVVAGAGTGAAFAIAGRVVEPATVAVPRVAGLTPAAAQQKLLDLGLISGGQHAAPQASGSHAAPGTVVGTQPDAGTEVAPGSIVLLLVASEQNAVPSPAPTASSPAQSSPAASAQPISTASATPKSTPTVSTSTKPKPSRTPKPSATPSASHSATPTPPASPAASDSPAPVQSAPPTPETPEAPPPTTLPPAATTGG